MCGLISISDTIINKTINTVNSAYLKFQNAMFQKSSKHSSNVATGFDGISSPLFKLIAAVALSLEKVINYIWFHLELTLLQNHILIKIIQMTG